MAVVIRHESKGQLHYESKAYFPLASAVFAPEADGRPCKRPSPWDLSALAGDERALATFFATSSTPDPPS